MVQTKQNVSKAKAHPDDKEPRTCNKDAKTYSPRVATRDMMIFRKRVFEKNVPKVNPSFDTAMFWIPFTARNKAANYENE